ncbi:MAG: hypothetical protein IPK69_04450 [Phycisphaerales bacterium]|nr:MAG: hypothetical protein IPK69_04450 [Phycisphaerales bacterium]
MTSGQQHSPNTRSSSRGILMTTAIACTLSFALVIWLKLRVVTSVPRQAYADPDQSAPVATDPKDSSTTASHHTPKGE